MAVMRLAHFASAGMILQTRPYAPSKYVQETGSMIVTRLMLAWTVSEAAIHGGLTINLNPNADYTGGDNIK